MGAIPELAPKYRFGNAAGGPAGFLFRRLELRHEIGGDVTPEKLAPFGIKTLVLSESCVQAGGRHQKADMNLLYDDELKLGKIFGKRQRFSLVEGWKRRLAALPAGAGGPRPFQVFVYEGRRSLSPAANTLCRRRSSKRRAAAT